MPISVSPTRATVSTSTGKVSFTWRIDENATSIQHAQSFGISSPVSQTGTSGTVSLGVGAHIFEAYYVDKKTKDTVDFGSATVIVTYEEPEPTQVTCTQLVYYKYKKEDGTYGYESGATQSKAFYVGYSFTPNLNQPTLYRSNYHLEKILYGSTDVTTGTMTCPSSNFTLAYYYEHDTATVTKNYYLAGTYGGSETESGLWCGISWTPSAWQPSVPSGYELDKILYGTTDVTTGAITIPTGDGATFTVNYYYVRGVAAWDWQISNGSATPLQTRAAYTAVTTGGAASDFSYLVWNDMCDKVQEVLDVTGATWVTKDNNTGETLLSLDDTKMTSSDKTLTAKRYNSLRLNVGSHYSTGIDPVSTGDKVIGQTHFINLMSKVNEWIATL